MHRDTPGTPLLPYGAHCGLRRQGARVPITSGLAHSPPGSTSMINPSLRPRSPRATSAAAKVFAVGAPRSRALRGGLTCIPAAGLACWGRCGAETPHAGAGTDVSRAGDGVPHSTAMPHRESAATFRRRSRLQQRSDRCPLPRGDSEVPPALGGGAGRPAGTKPERFGHRRLVLAGKRWEV